MDWIIGSGLRFGRLMVALAIGLTVIGFAQLRSAPVDVYPEFMPPSVEIQTEALGLSAAEVEQLITLGLEQDLLNGVPWLDRIHSSSMPGLSVIDLTFQPGTDLYAARQQVQERLTQAHALPNVGSPPIMVQPTAAAGRIAMIRLSSSSVSPIDMSVLARWKIKPRLMGVPGVANVAIYGQRDRQLQVQVDPKKLRAEHVTLTQLIETAGNALWVSPLTFVEASTPGTGGFFESANQRLSVQHISPISTPRQLAAVPVQDAGQLRLGDVANVIEDHQPLIGDAVLAGGPGVMLVVEKFPGADTRQVADSVQDILQTLRPGLNGVTVEPMIVRPQGRELIVGVIRDSVFGPAITVGMGGRAVEVLRDRAVALPPLNSFLVRAMIGRTRVSRLLGAFRRMPAVDMQALESVLLRVSEMVCELPQIEELEINPLIADESGAVAVDARAVVRDPQPARSRYAHMAIHPYPADLVANWELSDGTVVETRPIRPEDAEMERRFVKNLSDRSRYFRFMNSVRELTPAMLMRFTQIDYDREMAFVAVHSQPGQDEEIAVARYVTNPDGRTCEFAVVVADAWQGKGVGRRMLETLIAVARSRGLEAMIGHVLAANEPMLRLCAKLGFRMSDHPEDAAVRRAVLELAAPRGLA